MKKTIFLGVLLLVGTYLTAQQRIIQTCFAGAPLLEGVDVEIVGEDLYVLAHSEQDCGIDGDIYLTKLNASGSPEWTRSIGTAKRNTAQRLAALGAGVVVYGRTLQNNTNDCVDDVFAAHFDGAGNLIWEEAFGGSQSRDDENPGGIVVANGKILLSAYDLLGGNNLQEGYLVQLDANGQVDWSFLYSRTPNDPEIIEQVLAAEVGYVTSGRLAATRIPIPPFSFSGLAQTGRSIGGSTTILIRK